MKLVVLVKEVPDTYGERVLDLETGLLDRGSSELVPDEINERAVELALTHADRHQGTEVVVLCLGPESAVTSIRKGLAMGASRAVHVSDPGLVGADMMLTAETLAAVLRREAPDLVVAGNASTDGAGSVVPAAIAELLGWPLLSGLTSVELTGSSVSGSRPVETGVQQVSSDLPAVVSITDALPDPRFPKVKGIMAAKKKPFETLMLADLEVKPDDPGAARSIMLSVARRPARAAAGVKITDEGDAGTRIADFLVSNQLV